MNIIFDTEFEKSYTNNARGVKCIILYKISTTSSLLNVFNNNNNKLIKSIINIYQWLRLIF